MRTCVREKTADDLTHNSCLSIPDVTSLATLARWCSIALAALANARWVLVVWREGETRDDI